MLIHFAEHVGESYVEGCVSEIEEMGAVVEHRDKLTFSAVVPKARNPDFVVEFLRQEERRGTLRLETAHR